MSTLIKILSHSFSWILRRRYDIQITGAELLDSSTPLVILPNHPALVDPMIMMSEVGKHRVLSPIITETFAHTPGLGAILGSVGAVTVGDIARGGTAENVYRAFDGINEALKNKQNILLYPSGHVYVQAFEHVVGKKMAHTVLQSLPPDTRVILARTRGLWGSMWGKAYTGDSPDLAKILMKSLWYFLANLVFLIPKRRVTIEFVDITPDLASWQSLDMDSCNTRLEEFYNAPGHEDCQFVPHYQYYDDVRDKKEPINIPGSISEIQSSNTYDLSNISPDILSHMIEIVAGIKKISTKDLTPQTNLILDLHADSLDMAEIKSVVQSQYTSASNPPIGLIKTISDLALMSQGTLRGEEKLPKNSFVKAENTPIEYAYHETDTILSCMFENFRQEKKRAFIYDAMMGEMTREEFLMKAYVISEYIRGMETKIQTDTQTEIGTQTETQTDTKKETQKEIHNFSKSPIGIMLPALSASSLLLVGSYLADRIPVMLNWTVGEKSFEHCMQFAGLETILTSRKFYEKISSPWLAQYESKMVFIEDIVKGLGMGTKIRALIRKNLHLSPAQKYSDPAVILFTSGSESLPKAVVLTHQNILSDIHGALELVPFGRYETLLGFLPPFHSFGFTINTIFPLIAPVQVAYSPDPTDARTLGRILSHTGASIVSATPTFLRMILSGNDHASLASLRYVFVGAEKCSDEVFELFHEKCPTGVILEGYGITECSPIVTVNTIHLQKRGSTGKILPQIQCRIRSLDNERDMPTGEQGMIYLSGSSIFGGYIDPTIESPFDIFDGKKWYKTGDLGYIDADNFLSITGRLKRFVKIAGEMISLPSIESILLEKYGDPEVTRLAIEAREDGGNVTLVAFTLFDVDTDELNNYIHSHGGSNLIKIASVQKLSSIPVLGTGKTDYKALKEMI